MKNEPLDYFNKKNEQLYTLKSYRKLIIIVWLMTVVCFIFLSIDLYRNISNLPEVLLYLAFVLFLIIPFFSFWGLINIFQSFIRIMKKKRVNG